MGPYKLLLDTNKSIIINIVTVSQHCFTMLCKMWPIATIRVVSSIYLCVSVCRTWPWGLPKTAK